VEVGPVKTVSGLLVCLLAFIGAVACSHHENKKEESFCLTANISQSGTNLRLRNLDRFDWHNVKISVNGTEKSDGFEHSLGIVVAGTTVDLPLREFVRDDGMRFKTDDFVYLDGTVAAKEGVFMKELPCESGKSQ
jgi:hypothetical protein